MSESKRILWADDDPDDVELILVALAKVQLDDEVLFVRDGVEALNYLLRRGRFANRPAGNPAVVFLDIKMPKLDGFQVLKTMRSDPLLAPVPVVVFTSSQEPHDQSEGVELGANAYVVKPVQFAEFIDTVTTMSVFWAQASQPAPDTTMASGGKNGDRQYAS